LRRDERAVHLNYGPHIQQGVEVNGSMKGDQSRGGIWKILETGGEEEQRRGEQKED